MERSACLFAGISGIPKPRGSRRSKAHKFFFIQPPSAGIRRKRKNMAHCNTVHGKRFSAVTLLPIAITLQCRIESAWKKFPVLAAKALNFGDKVLLPEPPAKFSQKV